MIDPVGGKGLLHGAAQSRLKIAHAERVLLVDEGSGCPLVVWIGGHWGGGKGVGSVGEDDNVEQICCLQRVNCRGERAFDGLELALLHARRNIDDKGQAARQGPVLGQLGQRRQPQGVVA